MQGSRQSAGNWRTEEKLIDSYEKSTENRWIVGFTVLFLLCDRKFLSHKMLRKDALLRCHFGRSKSEVHRTSCSLAEMKYMLRIPLGRERVESDSFLLRRKMQV
mgnify:CR=1 FL=1